MIGIILYKDLVLNRPQTNFLGGLSNLCRKKVSAPSTKTNKKLSQFFEAIDQMAGNHALFALDIADFTSDYETLQSLATITQEVLGEDQKPDRLLTTHEVNEAERFKIILSILSQNFDMLEILPKQSKVRRIYHNYIPSIAMDETIIKEMKERIKQHVKNDIREQEALIEVFNSESNIFYKLIIGEILALHGKHEIKPSLLKTIKNYNEELIQIMAIKALLLLNRPEGLQHLIILASSNKLKGGLCGELLMELWEYKESNTMVARAIAFLQEAPK